MTYVAVASQNPVKLKATELGFLDSLGATGNFKFEGFAVESGVSDQPLSDLETFTGAQNRLVNLKNVVPDAEFWVSLEGGLDYWQGELVAFAWILIEHGDLRGKAKTGYFFLPQCYRELIDQGFELGHADDKIFGLSNSKQKGGTVGTLTRGVIDRTAYYRHAVNLALIPFLNTELYAV